MQTIVARNVPLQNSSVAHCSSVRGACSFSVLVALLGCSALVMGLAGAHWSAVGLGVVTFGLFLLIGTGILPNLLARRLQRRFSLIQPVHATFGPSVCIVLLGEGSTLDARTNERIPNWIAGSRICTAAALHRAAIGSGSVSRIIIAGDGTRSNPSVSPNSYSRALIGLGVLASDLTEENEGVNTYQHAKYVSQVMRAHGAESAYLVTSALHMKRALLYFSAFGLRLDPFPSDYVNVPIVPVPVGYNFAVADIALHQYIGIARFCMYQAFGLNKRPSPSPKQV
jgi:uncharacterized SAM-binding protein YcdF (DUF218 family)